MFMKFFSNHLMCVVYSPSAVCFLTSIYLNIAVLYNQVNASDFRGVLRHDHFMLN